LSVLIECLTLVVQTKELDIRYPGGSDAFLHAALAMENPPRFICSADPYLVNLSFYNGEHVQPCVELLEENGFTEVEDGRFADYAYVDQHHGPTMPCDWLEWKQHPHGFTYAWLAGTEPGDMAADEEWTPERSRAQERGDIRDDPGRAIRLAREGDVEVWLDMQTGRQIAGLARDSHPEPTKEEDAMSETPKSGIDIDAILRQLQAGTEVDKAGETEDLGEIAFEEPDPEPRLFPVVVGALEERRWNYRAEPEHTRASVTLKAKSAAFEVRLLVNESWEVIQCHVQLPVWVPEEKRGAMCEAITRANYALPIGSFEMDMSDGELRCTAGIDVEDGELSTTMVHNLIGACMNPADRYYPAFMRVIYADATPETAIDEVEN
jgi:hypothetical protein